jgi:hypothetical protein
MHDEEARSSAALALRLAFAGRFTDAETEAARLLQLAEKRQISAAAVDAWQTLAIIRQTQGALSAALDARRSAAGAARAAGLKEREAMLMTNLGFALTTIGARQEARAALETGLALADAIGSSGAVRHAQMNLLGWAATFGNDKQLEAHLAEARADADTTASGIWAAPDRANLGVLFYRGWEHLRSQSDAALRRARSLLELSARGYRATGNSDVLPVALGVWAEAERRCGNPTRAGELAREAADLLEAGAPSLLNESTVYLALHDAFIELDDREAARKTVARGIPALVRRLHGLVGTPYARAFLTEMPHNAGLLAAAEGYGLVPDENPPRARTRAVRLPMSKRIVIRALWFPALLVALLPACDDAEACKTKNDCVRQGKCTPDKNGVCVVGSIRTASRPSCARRPASAARKQAPVSRRTTPTARLRKSAASSRTATLIRETASISPKPCTPNAPRPVPPKACARPRTASAPLCPACTARARSTPSPKRRARAPPPAFAPRRTDAASQDRTKTARNPTPARSARSVRKKTARASPPRRTARSPRLAPTTENVALRTQVRGPEQRGLPKLRPLQARGHLQLERR